MSYNFSNKDIDTVNKISEGYTYKEIARQQNISPCTVVWRIQKIMKATNCRNKVQLINYFNLNSQKKITEKANGFKRFLKIIITYTRKVL